MLGGYCNGPIGAAHHGPLVIKGIGLPKSRTKPVSLEELVKVTVVPVLIQKALLDLAPGVLGVALAEDPSLRRMSTEHGEEAERQVFSAAQMLAGLEAEQTSFLTRHAWRELVTMFDSRRRASSLGSMPLESSGTRKRQAGT